MFTSTPVKKACDNLYACYSFKKLSLSRGAQIPGARLPWRISRLRNITGNGCRAGAHKYREPSRSSVSNLFHVTLLAPRILIWLIDFCKKSRTSAENISFCLHVATFVFSHFDTSSSPCHEFSSYRGNVSGHEVD